jgi:4,5-dihydroxyphthalate decarboxylase
MTFQHVIVIKRSIHEQHPWLARSVTKAFASSLEYAYDAISERAALRYMLPWLQDHVEETRKCAGVSALASIFADFFDVNHQGIWH